MKPKPKQKTEVTATTKVKLTIRGQVFEMTMEELKELHDKIGKVTGQDKPTVIFAPENDKARRRERPFYPPLPPQWFGPARPPDYSPHRIMCLTSGEGGAFTS